eukprot:scaffold57515_cov18-Prasinocladus_malaysianus.AAC.3
MVPSQRDSVLSAPQVPDLNIVIRPADDAPAVWGRCKARDIHVEPQGKILQYAGLCRIGRLLLGK